MGKVLLSSMWQRALLPLVKTDLFSFRLLTQVRYHTYERVFDLERPFSIGSNFCVTNSHHIQNTFFSAKRDLDIADNVYIDLSGSISIGKQVHIATGVKIFRHEHCIDRDYLSDAKILTRDLFIDDEVWIGSSSIILPHVEKIGYGAIIGAGSVVTKNVKPFEIVAGNPAKKIGKRKIRRRK